MVHLVNPKCNKVARPNITLTREFLQKAELEMK